MALPSGVEECARGGRPTITKALHEPQSDDAAAAVTASIKFIKRTAVRTGSTTKSSSESWGHQKRGNPERYSDFLLQAALERSSQSIFQRYMLQFEWTMLNFNSRTTFLCLENRFLQPHFNKYQCNECTQGARRGVVGAGAAIRSASECSRNNRWTRK